MGAPGAVRMRFLLDCVLPYAAADGALPAYDGDLSNSGMKGVCIDRHNGVVNCLFMDWSAQGRPEGVIDPQVVHGIQHLRPLDQGGRRPAGGLAGVDEKI